MRVGVPERIARVLMVTPSERGRGLSASLVALLVADRSRSFSGSGARLVRVLGRGAVAAAGRGDGGVRRSAIDPAREIMVAAPTPGFSSCS